MRGSELVSECVCLCVPYCMAIGSFHAQSTENCKDPPQILTKLSVFGVPIVLITRTDF